MGSPNREQLLNMAIQSAKQGNRQGAKVMLRQVLNEDKKNERAMLWMAKIATQPEERKMWLERVLQVNPQNASAKKGLAQISHSQESAENRRLILFGGIAVAAFMLITVLGTAVWAFAPLS